MINYFIIIGHLKNVELRIKINNDIKIIEYKIFVVNLINFSLLVSEK
tara:strand:+ start:1108 stop:1248 length:141 start_codon:yes stop_codon:yes gene_type:complete